MTVPAHTNATVATAEVLIAHSAATATAGFLPECRCGWIGSSWLTWVADLAQHQADELARAGLLADPGTRTKAVVKAEALREAADAYTNYEDDRGAAMVARRWLRDRADRIEREGGGVRCGRCDRLAPTVNAADVDVWAEWLFEIGYPFDTSWPENPPPVDHAVLARLWNERDGWRVPDDDAEACVRDAAGLTVADEGDDTDLDAGVVESAWAAEMDRRVAEMRRSPVDYLEAARSSNSVASWLSRALCPTTIRDGCPDSP